MKRTIIILSSVIVFLLFNASSCSDNGESFTQIKVIETQIYNEINNFRLNNGISANEPFVHQPIMVKEAQLYSAKMAYTTEGVDTTGIAVHWDMIHSKIGGTNDATLIQETTARTATAIVANWTADTAFREILLQDYSQCGAGVVTIGDSINYVTVMMMLIEQ